MSKKTTMKVEKSVVDKLKRNIYGDEDQSDGLNRILNVYELLRQRIPIVEHQIAQVYEEFDKAKQTGVYGSVHSSITSLLTMLRTFVDEVKQSGVR